MKTVIDNGTLLTLGLVGVVAAAGAVAKRGVGSMARITSVPKLVEALNARGFSFQEPYKTRSGTIQVSEPVVKPYGASFKVFKGMAYFRLLNHPVSISNVDDIIRAIEANKRNSIELDETGKISGSMASVKVGPPQLGDLKKGEFFKLKPTAKKVYRKGDYVRSERKYEALDTDDISRALYLRGSTRVFVDFEY